MRIKDIVFENFADGKNPGRKGVAKRSGVNTKASVSSLRKTAKHSTGEKARMAHWLANMKAGRAKHEDVDEGGFLNFLKTEPPKKKWDPAKDSRVVSNRKDDNAWIKLLLDKHRRGIELTDREWDSIKKWKLERDMQGEDVDEGWKDWVAGAAIGAAALGGHGDAEAAKKKHPDKPAVVHQVKQQVKPQVSAPVATPIKKVSPAEAESTLKNVAMKSGLKGTELAQFMAQCQHETLNFTKMKEIGGSLDFKKYDPKHAPKKAKQLGNTKVGDGSRYAGRGFIQLTGRDNYKRAGEALGLPLEQHPEMVENPMTAAKVAVWFWKNRVQAKVDNFNDTTAVTKVINPGLRGLDNRQSAFKDYKIQLAQR
jgi:predicted chitinase